MNPIRCMVVSVFTLSTLMLLYRLVIQNKASFGTRRIALLLILLCSIALPFLEIESPMNNWQSIISPPSFLAKKNQTYTLKEADMLHEAVQVVDLFSPVNVEQQTIEETSIPLSKYSKNTNFFDKQYLLIVYLLGFLLLGIRLLLQLGQFFLAIFYHKNIVKDGYRYVLMNHPNIASSFMNYILISKDIWESDDQLLIVEHECMHVRLWHSLDRLCTEILCVFQWFNPFIYWFRKDLIAVHEYQVDQALIANGVDSILYQQLIAKYASPTHSFNFGNHFNHSLTLNRIKMIAQHKTFTKRNTYRILLLFPMVMILSCIFAFQSPKTKPATTSSISGGITIPSIPSEIDFAGEALPMDNFDAKERFDRELISNCFRHSATVLFLKRANRYFPIIEPILAQHGIPDDIKYLAVAESALANAVSPMGAKGFWQFMPRSAQEKGLEISTEIDERYHLEKATVAACQYLKEAYQKLGSWTLAAAAYNMGRAGLQKKMTEQGGKNYFDLHLNTETARYVLRIMAIKEIMQHPASYGFNLEEKDLYPPMPTFKVVVERNAVPNLADYAKKHHISYRMLKLYNPWLLGTSLKNPNHKAYSIKIPVS
ncbi:M56 and MltD domain-containing protein [Aureispira anguillae]|uniref:M56 and MltD domain-containing protein n=1 Tax=Aureispira anguillae TaxID=2864201 RepID=A0A915YI68_9BACT|nr:M56 and MltD domain-containing protein [Aureispira anguillae]BDS13652.1 M56 and MltD domain-containing protein [Aureispira anguillae]